MDLAEGFVGDDGDGAGEVEGADGGGMDGDTEAGVWVCVEDGLWDSAGFRAEDEGIAWEVGDAGVEARGGGGIEPAAGGGGGQCGFAGGPRGVEVEGDGVPVIEAGAAEVAVIEGEAEGLDEVEVGSGGGAEAGDVAGIGGNFGIKEDDMEGLGGPMEVEGSDTGMGVFHGVAAAGWWCGDGGEKRSMGQGGMAERKRWP